VMSFCAGWTGGDLMTYDLNRFARNGAKLVHEFEKIRLDEFHKHIDELLAKRKAEKRVSCTLK
jgi:hypothetical protein